MTFLYFYYTEPGDQVYREPDLTASTLWIKKAVSIKLTAFFMRLNFKAFLNFDAFIFQCVFERRQ